MKTKLRRISKRTLSMLLSALMVVSVLTVGSIVSVSAATTTFYVLPEDDWLSNQYSIKVNTDSPYNNTTYNSYWHLDEMSFSGLTKDGKPIFKIDLEDRECYHIQISAYDGDTYKSNWSLYSGGSTKKLSEYSNKVITGASTSTDYDSYSFDTYSLYNSSASLGDFSWNSSSNKYTFSKSLNAGTTYNLRVYNSKYGHGSKYFQCTAKSQSSTGETTMYAYNTASDLAVISITPTITATFSFEWTLGTDRNDNDKKYVKKGDLNVVFPTTRTITVYQYKGSSGTTEKTGTVNIGGTSVTSNAGTAEVLDGTDTSTIVTAPTGYTIYSVTGTGWTRNSGDTGTEVYNGKINVTANQNLTVRYVPKTANLRFNANGATNSGTLPSNDSLTATYGSAMPTMTPYTAPTKTGYTLKGWYTAASGGTKYYNADGSSAASWAVNTTSAQTLYAQWDEVKAGATVKAYTNNSASGTGGTVKVDTGAAGATATIDNNSFGIDTASPAIIRATTAEGYTFDGWETGGTYGSHVILYTDSACSTPYNKATHGGSYSTVYAKTDGYKDDAMTTADTEIKAMFSSAQYTITYSGEYTDDGSTWSAVTASQGTFTVTNNSGGASVTSGTTVPYDTNLTVTATPASGYKVDAIYYKTSAEAAWTKMGTSTNASTGALYDNTFNVKSNWIFKAHFIKVYKLSAFDSYEKLGETDNDIRFITAPPRSIKIKHTALNGTETTYTYAYSGSAAKGNADTPDISEPKPDTLAMASGNYGQGNYIQFYAGDEITLTYSSMATSELIKGVFYNNSTNFYVSKPTAAQFVAHSHPDTPAIFMSNYYTSAQINNRTFTGVTVDQDKHSVKFTGTQNYKNIDVELATKRKIYFSDTKNTTITSKNTDNYYFDGEALSAMGDVFSVAAKQSAIQTNKIDNSTESTTKPKFYIANSDGTKGSAVPNEDLTAYGLSIATGVSTSTSSADGTPLEITGRMPGYDLYIELNMQNTYTLKAASKLISDLGGGNNYLQQVATTVQIGGTLDAPNNAYVSSGTIDIDTGSAVSLTVSGLDSGYMFVGWYWGKSDDSAPDLKKGFISDKQSLSYTPKHGGTIWAVGTKDLFINGSKYITGKDTDWYSEPDDPETPEGSSHWVNQHMSVEQTTGRYYWEITDAMFEAAGSNYKTWEEKNKELTNAYGQYYKGDDNYYYWKNNDNQYHGKSFFQLIDTAEGNSSKTIWNGITSFKVDTPANGPTYGKIYPSANDYGTKTWNGQGFINFNESDYTGFSSPLRIYYDPNETGNARLKVTATPIYSDLYVSNGFDIGSTLKSDAVTVEPVVNGVVKTSGQEGFFSVGAGTTYSPNHEGTVTKYSPAKKGATVRITKKAGGNDKVAAFFIYDIENKTVRAEKNITAGTTADGKTPYYIDLKLNNEKQQLYICPIIEEDGAKVTVTFDATQLNVKQWGDIVTAYAWYSSSNDPALGAYPGQPMIPSDDMSTWTTSFKPTEGAGGNELAGITFSNYVDGNHSWLGCSGVMGTVSDHTTGEASGGIINVYNHVDSGSGGEYSRTNYKAQTYDYHEPIALYDRYKNEDSVNISFQMKDGNSSLISWRHTNLTLQDEFGANENILHLPSGWSKLNWEYLTNAKGDQYIDMNGKSLGANVKPSATFYVAAKGQVVYDASTMKYVFHGGHDYQMKGYTGEYSEPTGTADRGSYTRNSLSSWSSDITYGAPGVSSLDMKYGVQWYVYDAEGNYITTVLSAGIADLCSSNEGETNTYLAKQLEDLGYAVDGKSVAICYDKPRYMYGDWGSVTDSADNINCGPIFDAYRFEGQWIAQANTDTVKVNVGVAMMTDSGEVLAHSNIAGYGNASASLASGVNFTKSSYATAASDGSWAQTAASDAKLNGIELNASSQNFIGWYYYDSNTDEFTKASYKSNEGFRPNYTNKDVTYYAVYRASAIYQYKYTGREGERTYSASGNDLTAAEMSNNNVIAADSHEEDIKSKVPVGIGIFKKNISFSDSDYGSWTKTPDEKGYTLDISGFKTTQPNYTLTAYYKNASGQLVNVTDSAVYNDKAVDLTSSAYKDSKDDSKPADTPVTLLYNKKFLGWYEYDGVSSKGDLISTQANYGLRLTKNQSVIAVYDETGSKTRPEDSESWKVHIDENELNKELTTSSTGYYYNDTIVRVRNGSDVKATLPTGAKIGVLVVCDNKTRNTINGYDSTQLTNLANGITVGKTRKTSSGLSVTNMQANKQTSFNRTDIAVRSDYAKNKDAQYCVYAYIKIGDAYYFSTVSDVKTYN